jgi:hypothetical protein
MNVDAVKNALRRFTQRHRAAFDFVTKRESQLLELGAMAGVESHYRSNGYSTKVSSPGGARSFVVKTSTRGHPSKYSSILLEKNGQTAEAHMNLLVKGAHDEGVYCVDVGIVRAGAVPTEPDRKVKWECVPNKLLLSFARLGGSSCIRCY